MTQLLVIGFLKAIRGKSLSKNKPTCETPLHRRSMEVRRSGLWAPDGVQNDLMERQQTTVRNALGGQEK